MWEKTQGREQAYDEAFPHREGKNEMYTQEVPDCVSCDRSPQAAFQIGYWKDILREGNKSYRHLRLTKWMFWCSQCLAKESLAPHWWGRAIRGEIFEEEQE